MRIQSGIATILATCAMVGACQDSAVGPDGELSSEFTRECVTSSAKIVRIDGGTFMMGQENVYAEEGPVRETFLSGFWIDSHEVTNRKFAQFADSTGYVTLAEKPVDPDLFDVPAQQIPDDLLKPGSAVFVAPEKPSHRYTDWWKYVPGASWRKPFGPDGPAAAADEPVVHLAYQDMEAYAQWAGGRLPTEAEWEYAAVAGAERTTAQPEAANSWQGVFPLVNEKRDGFESLAPVGCYSPNGYGLYDMIGNVWEMTADLYRPGHDPRDTRDPEGPSAIAAYDPANPRRNSRVVKGGSYLCAPNYCQRYRAAARSARDPSLGASNVGFRLVYDDVPSGMNAEPEPSR